MILKYAILWIASFVGISAVDGLWHFGLWGRIYKREIRSVATVADGKLLLRNASGLLSQILVITAFVVLASLPGDSGRPYLAGVVACVMGGVLGISVYGLVNHWLIRGWSLTLTFLEGIWGPLLGAVAGFFIIWMKKRLGLI